MKNISYIDLFAGAGGLSEGFLQAGFNPVAHVEVDLAACFTLKTRMSRHWLYNNGRYETYQDYLHGNINRKKLHDSVPKDLINSVINLGIGSENNSAIFKKIDSLTNRKIDLVIGGPPCQAYSIIGRSRDKNKMIGDSRNYLYKFYIEYLAKYRPRYFVFENVTGLLSATDEDGEKYFDQMYTSFREVGYFVEFKILNANNYGIPQNRKRVIIIGKHNSKSIDYPEPEKCISNYKISDLFSDLPELSAGDGTIAPVSYVKNSNEFLKQLGIRNIEDDVTWHIARPHSKQDLKIYKIAAAKWLKNKTRLDYNDLPENLKTHNNRNSFTDRFKIVAPDMEYSHTVVAHIAKDGHYYIHPDIKQNRSLTPREAARLQTFPDDYYFEGVSEIKSRTAAFKQIGNAVPVLLGRKIAEKLKENW